MSLIAAAALALGACGGDDNKSDSGTTGAGASLDQTTNSGTGETGTTGTTTRERTSTREGTTTRERTNTRERSGSGGGGSNGSGSGGGSDDSGSKATPALQPGNVEKTAKTVCTSFLPKQIEKDLEDGDRKAESVARDYSRGFPEKQQKAAYEGCLAGLKAR